MSKLGACVTLVSRFMAIPFRTDEAGNERLPSLDTFSRIKNEQVLAFGSEQDSSHPKIKDCALCRTGEHTAQPGGDDKPHGQTGKSKVVIS